MHPWSIGALSVSVFALLLVGPAATQPVPPSPAQPPATVQPPATPPGQSPIQLDATTATATRGDQPLVDVPASVTIIDLQELERRDPHTMRDAVRYEPGISVGNQPGRAGQTNYNIRGIGENRVRVQIDSVRVPDFPGTNIGAGTFTRDFVDLGVLRRVEFVRGPASALYGSDAIGGVVAYVTRDPSDLLEGLGRNWTIGGRFGYDSMDRSWSQSVFGAARQGQFEALAIYSHRHGHETRPNGGPGIVVNPQTYEAHNALVKFIYNATPRDRFRVTVELFRRDTDTTLLTEFGPALGAPTTQIRDSTGTDETRRLRISLDHVHEGGSWLADRFEWRLYYTNVNRRELSDQLRFQTGMNRLRHTDLFFDQDIFGGEVQFTNRFGTGSWQHTVTWGGSIDFISTTRPRDRFERNLVTGAFTQSFSGGPGVPAENFPNKLFPDTSTVHAGVYVQDQIVIGNVTLWPALRIDYYNLEPSPDADFARGNPGNFQISTISAVALSPKFGVTWRATEQLTLFGQYARGFRAPPYDDANIGFTNGPQRYEILPNANLGPETSDGFEAGVRLRFANRLGLSFTGFYNLYHDFIDVVQLGTRPPGIIQFQPRNVSQATIYGAEARGEWRITDEFGLYGALAYAHGQNEETNQPLDSVAPLTGVAALSYDHRSGIFGGRVSGIFAARHSRVSNLPATVQSVPPTMMTGPAFQARSYAVMDINLYVQPVRNIRINATVYNVFDAQYFNYLDVTGVAASSPQLGRFAAPGRTFTVSATLTW